MQKIIDELKKTYDEINEKREEFKIKIQKVFTNIRNEINKKEDELLLDVDKKFNSFSINKDYLINFDKLPSKVKFFIGKWENIGKKLE